MEKDNKKYDLTLDEYNKSLAMAEIATFIDGQKADKPQSIFIAAQAGARKNGIKKFFNK